MSNEDAQCKQVKFFMFFCVKMHKMLYLVVSLVCLVVFRHDERRKINELNNLFRRVEKRVMVIVTPVAVTRSGDGYFRCGIDANRWVCSLRKVIKALLKKNGHLSPWPSINARPTGKPEAM